MPEPEDETPSTGAAEAAEHIAEAAVSSTWKSVEAQIEIWFQDMRQGLRQLDTEAHNHLHTAKEELKARLRGLIA